MSVLGQPIRYLHNPDVLLLPGYLGGRVLRVGGLWIPCRVGLLGAVMRTGLHRTNVQTDGKILITDPLVLLIQ